MARSKKKQHKRPYHPKPYPRCIWCHRRADSREHAVPAWMSRRLGIKVEMRGWTRGLPRPRHAISFANYRRRIFCKSCNTHFKHLEDEVCEIVAPLARGMTMSLAHDTRDLMALWAAKTAMALLAAEQDDLIGLVPQHHRDAVRYSAEPPPECSIGYFRWGGRGPQIFGAENHFLLPPPNPPDQRRAYTSIFAFGTLGFIVTGVADSLPPRVEIGIGEAGDTVVIRGVHVVQFWPSRSGQAPWPPAGHPATTPDIPHLNALSTLGYTR